MQPDVFTATVVVDDSEQFGRDITCLVSGLGLSLLSLRPAMRIGGYIPERITNSIRYR